jgi:membrane protein insertase Oxa1/YidC/SpoIIIJ
VSELFESLYKFFGLILTRAYDVIPDFAWAIAILTIVSRLIVLPLSIKQSMLEINDAAMRLQVLARFLRQQGLL